jgi:cytosine/adenosine deaminase-related metal-dependent hydrolase
MFCACCRVPGKNQGSGFFAEETGSPSLDIEAALARRAAYRRRTAFSSAPVSHPDHTEFIVRRTCILTMDPHIGDLSPADLHVRDGVIVNIGRDLKATAMHEIDGRNAVALPGFVATHDHICTNAILDDVDEHPENDNRLPDLSPADASDIYRVLRVSLLDAMSCGITTVHHCAHDIGSGHAETAILAQIDCGIRGRFSYPLGRPLSPITPRDHKALERIERDWFASRSDHLLDLGIAIGRAAAGAMDIRPSQLMPVTDDHTAGPTDAGDLAGRTLGAAGALDLDHCIGSLSPGKRADLILIGTGANGERETISPQRGYEVARDARAADVLLVAIDGRLRKQNAVLTEPNEGLIRSEGQDAITRLRARAPWPLVDS